MDFSNIIAYRNAHNSFAKKLGIVVEEIRMGYARVGKTITEEDLNPLQFAHGGVYFSMADTACGSAAASHGYMAVTVNANYSFFRSAKVGDRLTAEAQELKHGKTICVYQVRLTDQNGTLLGSGEFTFYQLDAPIPESTLSSSDS